MSLAALGGITGIEGSSPNWSLQRKSRTSQGPRDNLVNMHSLASSEPSHFRPCTRQFDKRSLEGVQEPPWRPSKRYGLQKFVTLEPRAEGKRCVSNPNKPAKNEDRGKVIFRCTTLSEPPPQGFHIMRKKTTYNPKTGEPVAYARSREKTFAEETGKKKMVPGWHFSNEQPVAWPRYKGYPPNNDRQGKWIDYSLSRNGGHFRTLGIHRNDPWRVTSTAPARPVLYQ